MEIRKAKVTDLELLVENRLEFVCSIRELSNIEAFKILSREYLEQHLEDDSLIVYIAMDNGEIIASSMLSVYETLPINCLSNKTGLLLNVYTAKAYRHQGLAYRLLTELIEEAKRSGVGKIRLDYTDDGYPLYVKTGFRKLDREMVLDLYS